MSISFCPGVTTPPPACASTSPTTWPSTGDLMTMRSELGRHRRQALLVGLHLRRTSARSGAHLAQGSPGGAGPGASCTSAMALRARWILRFEVGHAGRAARPAAAPAAAPGCAARSPRPPGLHAASCRVLDLGLLAAAAQHLLQAARPGLVAEIGSPAGRHLGAQAAWRDGHQAGAAPPSAAAPRRRRPRAGRGGTSMLRLVQGFGEQAALLARAAPGSSGGWSRKLARTVASSSTTSGSPRLTRWPSRTAHAP